MNGLLLGMRSRLVIHERLELVAVQQLVAGVRLDIVVATIPCLRRECSCTTFIL